MKHRYPRALALTSLALLLAAAPGARHTAAPAVSALYSRTALRRVRIVLQLKLLELRKERLERVLRAIRKGIPIDEILKQNPPGRV